MWIAMVEGLVGTYEGRRRIERNIFPSVVIKLDAPIPISQISHSSTMRKHPLPLSLVRSRT